MALACAPTKDSDKPVHPGSLVESLMGTIKVAKTKTLIDSVDGCTD